MRKLHTRSESQKEKTKMSRDIRRRKIKREGVFSVTNSKVFGLTHSKYLECA